MDIQIRNTNAIPPNTTARVSEQRTAIENAFKNMKPGESFLVPVKKTYGGLYDIARSCGVSITIRQNEAPGQAAVYLVGPAKPKQPKPQKPADDQQQSGAAHE